MNHRSGLRKAGECDDDKGLIVLLGEIADGDESSLRILHDMVYAKLFASAMKIVRRRDSAEDVVQEAFLSIWRVSVQYRPLLSPPMAWLFMIVRSRALEALRKRATSREDVTDDLDEVQPSWDALHTPDPAELVSERQQLAALHDTLAQLEGRQRKLIGLAFFGEMTHAELANQVELPLGTVKSLIRKGLIELRERLSRINR